MVNVEGMVESRKFGRSSEYFFAEVQMRLALAKKQQNEIVHKEKKAYFVEQKWLIGQYQIFLKNLLDPNGRIERNKTFV